MGKSTRFPSNMERLKGEIVEIVEKWKKNPRNIDVLMGKSQGNHPAFLRVCHGKIRENHR